MNVREQRDALKRLRQAMQAIDEVREMLWARGTGFAEGSQHWYGALREIGDRVELIHDQIKAARPA